MTTCSFFFFYLFFFPLFFFFLFETLREKEFDTDSWPAWVIVMQFPKEVESHSLCQLDLGLHSLTLEGSGTWGFGVKEVAECLQNTCHLQSLPISKIIVFVIKAYDQSTLLLTIYY